MSGREPGRWAVSRTLARRGILRVLSGLPLLALGSPAFARRTPSATEGPFYPTPEMRFTDVDNDLVKNAGQVKEAGGEVILLRGRVLDSSGVPARGVRVEIWQCDTNGRYLHPADRRRGSYDNSFQGFGSVVTGTDGVYAFRTIKPVPYTGRTPHIHVKVHHGGGEVTTQFYLKDHPLNRGDALFQRMTEPEQEAVTMTFADGPNGPEANVDISL